MHQIRSRQKGIMLLEALIGLLIFSIGILALIAMQSVAISQVRDANFRSTASMLADRVMGELVVMRSTTDSAYAAKYSQWQTEVASSLPSGSGTITGSNNASLPGTQDVRIVITWRAPDASANSNHTVVGLLSPTNN